LPEKGEAGELGQSPGTAKWLGNHTKRKEKGLITKGKNTKRLPIIKGKDLILLGCKIK